MYVRIAQLTNAAEGIRGAVFIRNTAPLHFLSCCQLLLTSQYQHTRASDYPEAAQQHSAGE